MYEETKSGIDWKGLFLKLVIAFLIVLIAIKGYSTLKGNNDVKKNTTTETTAESKSSSTFTANIEKLRDAGEKYFTENKEKLPKTEGNTSMVTLNELVKNGNIEALADEDGKTCDGESSYVTAISEGNKTKIKANLVCGNASSYKLVYMGENDSNTEVSQNVSTNTNTSNSNTNSSKTSKSNTCTSNCGTPVSVSTNTTVSQKVSISNGNKKSSSNSSKNNNNNSNNNTSDTRYVTYRVRFDSNGGSKSYASQTVKENDRAYNPGSTYKSGYTFKGWYLNGYEYDFNSRVTSDITLVAKFTKNSNSRYDYDDDYYDYDYDSTATKTYTTTVYSMGWDAYTTNYINVSHTLRVPETLANNNRITRIRIKSVSFDEPLTTATEINRFYNRHSETFLYSNNGFEAQNLTTRNLSNIRYASVTAQNKYYKSYRNALNEGFNVEWSAYNRNITDCRDKFHIYNYNNDSYIENLCAYGIIYKVVWEYEYYR